MISKIKATRKAAYEKENARIKKLPAKERAAARKKLKSTLKTKHDKLVKKLKAGTHFKSVEALRSAISLAKSLKW